MQSAAAVPGTPLEPLVSAAPPAAPAERAGTGRRGGPLPLRPRGGFGGYLHDLRAARGLTIRQLAAAAGVHHTYVSKLERGDRQAPDEAVIEALAGALDATPAQVDQLRWRAGLSPRGSGAPGQDDPTLTLVAEALGNDDLPPERRDHLRQTIAQVVQGAAAAGSADGSRGAPASGVSRPAPWPAAPLPAAPALPGPSIAPAAPPDGRSALVAGLLGGWQTLDEAAAELRVTPAYLWELVQLGHLRAWALPGAPPNNPLGVRLRRDDVLALLTPVAVSRS